MGSAGHGHGDGLLKGRLGCEARSTALRGRTTAGVPSPPLCPIGMGGLTAGQGTWLGTGATSKGGGPGSGAQGTGVYVGKHRILGTEVLEDLTTVWSNFPVSGNPSFPSPVPSLQITHCLNLI